MRTDAFRAAMQARGLLPPSHIEPGKLFRCGSSDKPGDTAGWGTLFVDGRCGVFGNWRGEGWKETWRAERDKPLSPTERAELQQHVADAQRQRNAEQRARHEVAEQTAAELWGAASPAPSDHPYLARKAVKAHGLRIHDGALLVPVRIGSDLRSLQFIAADGSKRFLPGGRLVGGYYSIGNPDGALCIAEGFATAASIREATGNAVAIAFNAGNLRAVANAMREKFPDTRLILCADDDAGTEGNPGLSKARAAAEAVGGFVAVPDFGDNRPDGVTDFNDLALHAGADAVRRCIEQATQVAHMKEADPMPRAILTRGDAIQIEPINWLWNGWLAAAKLHILAGAPGTGKTTLALAMAATVTVGGCWPDGTRAERGCVVMWSGEDDPGDTLAPRLKAMNADLSRVHFVAAIRGTNGERLPFDPSRDVDLLSAAMANLTDVRLLIVDPIVSAVAGDSHNNAETRRSLQPLVDLAAQQRCALVGITHLSKGTAGRDPVERVTGSIAFGAVARVVLMAAKKTAEDGATANTLGQRMLLRAKSNIGPDTGGYAYDLRQVKVPEHPDMVASSVQWGPALEGNARELLADAELPGDDQQGERRSAADWLRDALTDGPVAVAELKRQATESGFAWRTMQRAMHSAGAVSRRAGFSQPATWFLGNRAKPSPVAPVTPAFESGANGATGGAVDL